MKYQMMVLILALLPIGMMGQNETTSRLEVFDKAPLMKNGIDYYQKLINTFKYGGNRAAELWYETEEQVYRNKYDALSSQSQSAQRQFKEQGDTVLANRTREQYNAQIEEVSRRMDEFDSIYTQYKLLFIEGPSFDAESALAYKITSTVNEKKDGNLNTRIASGELIAMKSDQNIWFTMTQPPFLQTVTMDIDGVLLDSLLHLTAYACYTSANRDNHHMILDGTSYYLFWQSMKSTVSHDADGMQKLLAQTFSDITEAVLANDKEKIKSLAPTINRLLAHYRSLQLPDQYIKNNLYMPF